ncbi:type I secretion system permease/ATPase [Brevundimonas naejangsanensis]|uniref:Type I secretion system permease/ATPase n=2 Tax=Brevundimonas naejangsanensis TaxID=588932 RepID=A0A494RJ03_9CAUL|nr:type I secretion system permease/ATPase [Brevundimonas naejangsanensis]
MPKPFEAALKACRGYFWLAAFFSALVNLLYLAPTIYMMQVYDRVVPSGSVLTLAWLTVVVCFALATLAALDATRNRVMSRASLRLNRILAGSILDHLMMRRRLAPGEPSTAQAMRDFDALRTTLTGPAAIALMDIPWTPIYLIVAFMIHPFLGGLIIVGGCVLTILALANERSTRQGSADSRQASALSHAAHDTAVSMSEVIRALGMRRAVVSRQLEARSHALAGGLDAQMQGSRYTALVKFTRMALQSMALGLAAWLAVKGQISVGAIIAGSVLLSRALQPIEQTVGAWPSIAQARQALGTLRTLLADAEVAAQPVLTLPPPLGHVELLNISVRNPEGTAYLLRSVSIALVPGEIVGLIGPSGAGKSTLSRVAAGALEPDGGEIRIDGASYADWDPESLARHIGYLPQDCGLLPGSISDNIARFSDAGSALREEIDRRVVEAAMRAGAHEMILRLPGGYNAQLGANGQGLSGGQAQRIALARALYGDPKVLVLDEPSASLDAEGELALRSAMDAARARGTAILIVAHRSAVLRNVDRLAVLSNGMIETQGPQAEVRDTLAANAAKSNVVNMKPR